MRNLIPYVSSQLLTAEESPLPLRKFLFAEHVVVCAFADDSFAALAVWSPQTSWSARAEWPLQLDGVEPGNVVVGLHYDALEEKAVVVLVNGDFIEVRNGEATVVGSLETEVEACEWSPTGELACLVTRSGKVMLLSTDFDLGDVVMGEHQMTEADLELAEKHVSVGWGKRETQFQGRGARAVQRSQDPTVNQDIELRDPVPTDRQSVTLSWRGDGEFVVVNSNVGNQRALRVLTPSGQLDSVSEPASQLYGLVAYEPRGALIATVRPNEVQFFERNGLKRYSFAIDNADDVVQLAWSSDSSILAIGYDAGYIDLWTQKNWHWYRKQRVFTGGLPAVVWHPELPRTMGVSVESDLIQFHSWEFGVASDQGLVAVIDKDEVKVTPLAVAGIPPPMAFSSCAFSSQPVAVAVQAPSTVAVALANEVQTFMLDLDTAELVHIQTVAVSARQLAFSPSYGLIIEHGGNLIDSSQAVVAQPAAAISVLKGSNYMIGSKLYDFGGQLVADFNEPCTDFVAAPTESFGLTRSAKLVHSSGAVVAHGVTSMLSTPTHLLFTTLTTLNFLHLNSGSTDFRLSGEQQREIERGSVLVSIMSEQMAVVLQAPRGNIETIYPRMLVLGVVRENVARLQYAAAFTTCKVHRIDMNLLYDLNPTQFDTNMDLFVRELGSPANLDLFLSALSDENVVQTKYRDTSTSAATATPISASVPETIDGKANRVLRMLKPHLPVPSTITALAMMKPPAVVEALQESAHSPELIKHLVFLTEADELYRTALGGYEPRLALAVAQQAQMDPKEYMPFLRSLLTEKSTHRAKFNIDVFLRRYDRAAEHLIADNGSTEQEIADFVIHHDLHDLALAKLQGSGRESERVILGSRAQIYLSQSDYVRAGLDFELLGETARAVTAYVQGCAWRRALSLAPQNMDVCEQLVETGDANKQYGDCAHLLLHYLHRPQEALSYFCQANLFDDAVLVASEHDLKSELDSQLRDCYGTFQELIADCRAQVPAQLKRLRQIRAKRQQDSLGFDKMAEQVDELDVADNLSLTGTDASTATGASAYTRYTDKSGAHTVGTNATRRTLKNQRRQERKKARGKKGSVYEEDYLVASTGRLIDRLAATRQDLTDLVAALTRTRQFFYANQLTTEFNAVLRVLEESIGEIYDVDEESLVRFDESGHEYLAPKPVAPQLPSLI